MNTATQNGEERETVPQSPATQTYLNGMMYKGSIPMNASNSRFIVNRVFSFDYQKTKFSIIKYMSSNISPVTCIMVCKSLIFLSSLYLGLLNYTS